MKFTRTTAAALAAACLSTAAIADDAFLKFPNSEIIGDSVDKAHKDEIVVTSYSIGVSADTSWTKGGGAAVGKPQPGEFVFTMAPGRAFPGMFRNIVTGQQAPNAVLSVNAVAASATRPGAAEYLRYTFTNAFFTNISQAASGDRGQVEVSMVYKTLKIEVMKDGKAVSCVTWDIPAGQANSGCSGPIN